MEKRLLPENFEGPQDFWLAIKASGDWATRWSRPVGVIVAAAGVDEPWELKNLLEWEVTNPRMIDRLGTSGITATDTKHITLDYDVQGFGHTVAGYATYDAALQDALKLRKLVPGEIRKSTSGQGIHFRYEFPNDVSLHPSVAIEMFGILADKMGQPIDRKALGRQCSWLWCRYPQPGAFELIEEHGENGFELPDCLQDILEEMRKNPKPQISHIAEPTEKDCQKFLLGLKKLNPSRADSYDDWINVIAIRSTLPSNPELTEALVEWSAQSKKFKGREEVLAKLESFKRGQDKKRLTLATLIWMCRQDGFDLSPKRKGDEWECITVKCEDKATPTASAFSEAVGGEEEDFRAPEKPPCPTNEELIALLRDTPLGVGLEAVQAVIPNVEPLIPIGGTLTLLGAMLTPRVRLGMDLEKGIKGKATNVYTLAITGSRMGKGVTMRMISAAMERLSVSEIGEGSDKAVARDSGKNPWGICTITELGKYMTVNSWRKTMLEFAKQVYDDDKYTYLTDRQSGYKIYNLAPSFLMSIQPDVLVDCPISALLADGLLNRILPAHDKKIESQQEYVTVNIHQGPRDADPSLLIRELEGLAACLPAPCFPARETVEDKTIAWHHPLPSASFKVDPYRSILENYQIPQKYEGLFINMIVNYLPIIAVNFECPENLRQLRITTEALKKADVLILAFWHSAMRFFSDVPETIAEINARKVGRVTKKLSDPKVKDGWLPFSHIYREVRVGRNRNEAIAIFQQAVDWKFVECKPEKKKYGNEERTVYYYRPIQDGRQVDSGRQSCLPFWDSITPLNNKALDNQNINGRQVDRENGVGEMDMPTQERCLPVYHSSPTTPNPLASNTVISSANGRQSCLPSAYQASTIPCLPPTAPYYDDSDDDDITFCPSKLLSEMRQLKAELRAAGKKPVLTPEQEDYFFGGKAS